MMPVKERYTSNFVRWYDLGTIYAKPRRMIEPEKETDKVFFPESLLAISGHGMVRALGSTAMKHMLVQRLLTYLEFTARLEQEVVIPVLTNITCHYFESLELPHDMIDDAYKIGVDEAHHAEFSADLRSQVCRATGVTPMPTPRPSFLRRLDSLLKDKLPADLQPIGSLFFAIVSETLISAILSDIPRDGTVVTAVRQMVADHAEDEARHNSYFSHLLAKVWPQLDPDVQAIVGPLLPEFILAFLEPDIEALAATLTSVGLGESGIQLVLDETFPTSETVKRARIAASRTLKYFDRVGVMSQPETGLAFERHGLWPN